MAIANPLKLGNIRLVDYVYTRDEVDQLLARLQPALTFDDVPTDGSQNPVRSNGIYQEIYSLVQAIGQAMDDIVASVESDLPFSILGSSGSRAVARRDRKFA